MATFDPYPQPAGRPVQPGVPPAQPLPGAGVHGAGRAAPQAQPVGRPQSPAGQAAPGPNVPLAAPVSSMQHAAGGAVLPAQPGRPAVAGQAAAPGRPASPGRPGGASTRPTPVQGKRTLVRERGEESEQEEDVAASAIKNAPPWLVSAAFHMLLLIILGLIAVALGPPRQIVLDMLVAEEDVWAEKLGEQVEIDSVLGKELIDAVEEPVLTPDNLPEVEDPFAAPPTVEFQPDGTTATSDLQANQIGLALMGREEGMKKTLLGRYGGNRLTEEAVRLGLEWLARQQQRDGHWSLCGPYSDGVPQQIENRQAATAMALLAFQGYGVTHQKGDFQKNVANGWNWLIKDLDGDGNFYHEGPFHHRFYTQAQCSIALLELYGMTKDPTFRDPAERVVKYLLEAQAPEGGWRYTPKSDSDVSVTGWVVMALQSAKMAGLEVPDDNLRRIDRFLDRVAQQDGARYPYQQGRETTLAMTAEALLCRQYLGWARNDPRLMAGMEWITAENNLINFERGRDVYFWYYATQAAHHMEGEYWKRWNGVMRQILPEQQVKRGREAGSWDPNRPSVDQWSAHGGRLYVTCLSIYMLEVYYRHLPIYTKVYTDLLKSGRAPGM